MLTAIGVGFYSLVPAGTVEGLVAGLSSAASTRESEPNSPTSPPPAAPDPLIEAGPVQPAGDLRAGRPDEDPEGLRLDLLAMQYVQRANQALDSGLLPQAQNFIDLAVALTPTEPDTAEALNQLISRSAKVSQSQREIDKTRRRWEQQLERGNYFTPGTDNAYLTLASMETMTPDLEELPRLRRQLNRLSSAQIDQLLSGGKLKQAARAIEQLSAQAPNAVTAPLSARLDSLSRSRILREQRLQKLLADAKALEASAPAADTHARLLELYAEALALSPSNSSARLGLTNSSRSALNTSAEQLASGRLADAATTLALLERYTPATPELAQQQADLEQRLAQQKRAQQQLAQAKNALAGLQRNMQTTSKSAVKRRSEALIRAWKNLDSAARLAPHTTDIEPTREAIASAYRDGFSQLIDRKDLDSADAYLQALASSGIDTAGDLLRLMNTELEDANRSKPDRFPSF